MLSAVVPGAGQLYAGDPYRAAIVFSPTVLVVTGMFAFAERGSIGMGELLVQPTFLSGLLVANALILVWRVVAAVDAYLLISDRDRRSVVAGAVLVAVLGVLMAPQLVGWIYGARAIAALNTVFVASAPVIEDPGPVRVEPVYAANLGLTKHPVFVDLPELDPRSPRNMVFREGL